MSTAIDITAELDGTAELRREQRLWDLYCAHVARGSEEPYADAEMSLLNWYVMEARGALR